ncbi:MAG: mechanosensitive ion channel [Bacteroidaceae bacterium]|nr:mechanosensitive ion channel [Bacteroidaceae bacterium]
MIKTIERNIDDWLKLIGLNQDMVANIDQYVILGGIVLVALLVDYICRVVILQIVGHLVKRTKATWDDILFDRKVLKNLTRIVAPVLIYLLIPIFLETESAAFLSFLLKLCQIYVVASILRFVNSLFISVYHIYNEKEMYRDRPLKGLLQTAQIILFFIGGILIIGILIDRTFDKLIVGLGASATILMLVFRDSILGFVSGIMLSANNMLRIGDWITVPKYGADGCVVEITLNTVKVRNWDNTITTLPPYVLTSDSFQNWRGMFDSGGRRIKRSINIDMTSVRFCTPEMLEKYKKIEHLKEYIEQTEQAVNTYNEQQHIDDSISVNGLRQTNLGIFRTYMTNYLKRLPDLNPKMFCMVRYLPSSEMGLPVELYFFSAVTTWVDYEKILANVIDHVLAIIPEFDLRVFQIPSGYDFKKNFHN